MAILKNSADARVLILGMGDLGVRMAHLVAERGLAKTCLLAGQSDAAKQWAQLLRISSDRDVRSTQLDGQDPEAVKRMLVDFEPTIIVQCATLLSPFALRGVRSAAAESVLRGGFALQAAGQLPVIRTLMQVRRGLGMTCPVINCSYPDLTNAVLAAEGLAPDSGIGNVAIMALRFARLMGLAGDGDLHVIGQHAQLMPSLSGVKATDAAPVPMVYHQGRRLSDDELLIDTGPVGGPGLNHLAAATALTILQGFLDRDGVLDTHAPGVLGLPGGYPVRIRDGAISLRLPTGVTSEDAVAFNQLAGRGEGIEAIDESGTVHYTEQAKQAVAETCPELAEPLPIHKIHARFELLHQIAQG